MRISTSTTENPLPAKLVVCHSPVRANIHYTIAGYSDGLTKSRKCYHPRTGSNGRLSCAKACSCILSCSSRNTSGPSCSSRSGCTRCSIGSSCARWPSRSGCTGRARGTSRVHVRSVGSRRSGGSSCVRSVRLGLAAQCQYRVGR